MKDKKLEEQFNEYFEGAEIPENLARDAKKYVKKPSRLPEFVKYLSAAACFVLCFAVVLTLIFRYPEKTSPPASDGTNAPDAPEGSVPPNQNYYSAEQLTVSVENAYCIADYKSELQFMERLAFSKYCDISVYSAEFESGATAYVKAEVVHMGDARDDTEIFVEYASGVYEPLKDYSSGEKVYYANNVYYYITRELADNGEPVSKVYVQKDGVKYYFSVTSADTQSYKKYLKLILG